MTFAAARHALRLGRPSLVALCVALAVTVAGFFIARQSVADVESQKLEEQSAQLAAIIGSSAREIEALLYAGSVIVDVTGGDPDDFERLIEGRLGSSAVSSIALLGQSGSRWVRLADTGAQLPLLFDPSDEEQQRRLDAIAEQPGELLSVEIASAEAEGRVSFATASQSGRYLVYGESFIPTLSTLFPVALPGGIEYGLYLAPASETNLIQGNTSDLPDEGTVVRLKMKVGSEDAVLVVGTTGTLVSSLVEAAPWLVLGGGLAVSLILAYGLELTQRRTAERESRRALIAQNERLRELDGLKDELVATVSHELRTPLTSILGYLELIREEPATLSDEQRGFLAVVERNARRLLNLVSDLLFVARIDAGRLELDQGEVDLAAVARESVESQRPRAVRAGVVISLTADSPPAIIADRARLVQLLDNLVSNAVKFTQEGGRVDVRVSGSGPEAVIEVSDTGMGIPVGEQDRLFQRFFRSSTASAQAIPGTGLGLVIVKAIVDAHGGRIEVESGEGAGTTFKVWLPVEHGRVSESRRADVVAV